MLPGRACLRKKPSQKKAHLRDREQKRERSETVEYLDTAVPEGSLPLDLTIYLTQ